MEYRGLHQVAGRLGPPDASRAFYEDLLGLRIIARFDPPGILFVDLSVPGVPGPRLLLEASAPQATLYLMVEDLDATFSSLSAAGVYFLDAPHRVFLDDQGTFGPAGEAEWMTFAEDPGGNTIALVERR